MRFRPSPMILSAAMLVCGCGTREVTESPQVEFGVFYGGQVQERTEIPFEIDPGKQRYGFRIHLSPMQQAPVEIRWEMDMPGSAKKVRGRDGRRGTGRLVSVGSFKADPQSKTVDQAFSFNPGDPLGLYNFRLLVDNELVADRAILVYDPSKT